MVVPHHVLGVSPGTVVAEVEGLDRDEQLEPRVGGRVADVGLLELPAGAGHASGLAPRPVRRWQDQGKLTGAPQLGRQQHRDRIGEPLGIVLLGVAIGAGGGSGPRVPKGFDKVGDGQIGPSPQDSSVVVPCFVVSPPTAASPCGACLFPKRMPRRRPRPPLPLRSPRSRSRSNSGGRRKVPRESRVRKPSKARLDNGFVGCSRNSRRGAASTRTGEEETSTSHASPRAPNTARGHRLGG